jgi:antitoxin CptB
MSDRETRLKRLQVRSWRRGIREMDLLLGGFATDRLPSLSDAELDLFEALLEENDHDLYIWLARQSEPPAEHAKALALVAAYHNI